MTRLEALRSVWTPRFRNSKRRSATKEGDECPSTARHTDLRPSGLKLGRRP